MPIRNSPIFRRLHDSQGPGKPGEPAHAILAARKVVEGPFAVVNADDYYGPEAFREIYQYLENHPDQENCYEFAMVGYRLGNTVTEHGHVARGVCEEDENNYLIRVTERTKIVKDGDNARFTEDDGQTWTALSGRYHRIHEALGLHPQFPP